MSNPTSCLILGAGASGLSASHVLKSQGCDDWLMVDAASRCGGKIRTLQEDGYVIELGPTGWLDHQPEWGDICHSLNLQAIRSQVSDGNRLLLHDGKLLAIPEPGPQLIKANFLSLAGKLRLGLSLFHPRKLRRDESVYNHGMRRFGRQLTETLLDAAAGGLFAGDPKKMSVRGSFPQLLNALPKGPAPNICSFANGMSEWTRAFEEKRKKHLLLNCKLSKLELIDGLWHAWQEDKCIATSRQVVSTIPAKELLSLLGDTAPTSLIDCVKKITRSDLAVVAGAWHDEDIENPCEGFGVLAPSKEEAGFLNVQFIHSIFPQHTPKGFKVLKAMLGGARNPDISRCGPNELQHHAFGKLKTLLGVKTEPSRLWVHLIPGGVPQYHLGHLERVASAEKELATTHPGLLLAGDSFHGVGLNPAVRRAHELPLSVKV